jgi:hypothetical protein
MRPETTTSSETLKQPYATPRVTVLGKVTQLTQAKGGKKNDGSPHSNSRA